jgi:hypothetical protein
MRRRSLCGPIAEVSGLGALQEELQLTHGRPADVEHGPTRGQKDGSGHEHNPEIHGAANQMGVILKT